MTRRILIPLDGSREDEAAVSTARMLAAENAEFILFHSVPCVFSPVGMDPTYRLELERKAADYLADARERFTLGRGTDVVRSGDPGEQVFKASLELNIDLIGMGTHARRGLPRALLGSVALEVVRRSQLPVVLVRPGLAASVAGLKKILVPVAETGATRAVLRTVIPIAARTGAELVLLHVREPVHDPTPQFAFSGPVATRGTPEYRLEELVAEAAEADLDAVPIVTCGNSVQEILGQIVALKPDLVAMATHGRDGLERALEGSVAESVLRKADRPVLLQKPLVRRMPVMEGESDE